MCRSANEPSGPRRCPSHAYAKYSRARAEVLALEIRELELYREISQLAADLIGPSASAHRCYREAVQQVEQLRAEYNASGDIPLEDYREAYREMLSAKEKVDRISAVERQALDVVEQRRGTATEALSAVGICAEEADRVLTGIDRETTLAPPF